MSINIPLIKHDINMLGLYIKTPQLIGILVGCIVFIVTIAVVIYLLHASGSLTKFLKEISNNVNVASGDNGSNDYIYLKTPLLYDKLILASESLTSKPIVPKLEVCFTLTSLMPFNTITTYQGKLVDVAAFKEDHISAAMKASNGSAFMGESQYDAGGRIWSFIHKALLRWNTQPISLFYRFI